MPFPDNLGNVYAVRFYVAMTLRNIRKQPVLCSRVPKVPVSSPVPSFIALEAGWAERGEGF